MCGCCKLLWLRISRSTFLLTYTTAIKKQASFCKNQTPSLAKGDKVNSHQAFATLSPRSINFIANIFLVWSRRLASCTKPKPPRPRSFTWDVHRLIVISRIKAEYISVLVRKYASCTFSYLGCGGYVKGFSLSWLIFSPDHHELTQASVAKILTRVAEDLENAKKNRFGGSKVSGEAWTPNNRSKQRQKYEIICIFRKR